MATSGSTTVAVASWLSLKFSWSQISQSVANNTTTISWNLVATTNSAGALYKKNRTWTVVIDGTTYTGSVNVSLDKSSSQSLANGTATIKHNADGSKSFAYSFSQQFELTLNSGKYLGTGSGSGSDTLTTIPRESSLTIGNGTLGTAQTLTVTQKSSSFTHTITASCRNASTNANVSTNIVTESNALSVSWTAPLDWAQYAPNDNEISITFRITTYSGDTKVGATDTTVKYAIPNLALYRPSLVPTITDATSYDQLLGGWVQGQSRVKVDIETYGAYGATIKEVKTVFEGHTYNGTSITTNTIAGHDVLPITISVTDSRGRTTTVNPEIFVQKYSYPKITLFTARRCTLDDNQNPVLNPLGDHILVSFGAEIRSLNNNNTAKYYIGYKKVSEANHTAVEQTNLEGLYSVNSTYVVPADPASSYTIIFTAVDAFTPNGTRLTLEVPSAKQVFSLMKKNGEIVGIAINKVAEHEGYFDIGMPVLFSGEGDIVVEQGEKDGWTYRKWQSGVMECWKKVSHTTKLNTVWGGMYVGNPSLPRQNYPFPFISPPVENVTVQSGWYMGMPYADINGNGTNGTHATAIYNVASLSQVNDSITIYFSISVKGKWK